MADRTNRELRAEIGVVLAVALLPEYYPIVVSFFFPGLGESSGVLSLSRGDFLSEVIKHSSLSVLPLYLIWRSGEPWRRFGFTHPRWFLDTSIIIGVLFANYMVAFGVSLLSFGPGHFTNDLGEPGTAPETTHFIVEEVFFFIDTGGGAFYEELFMRGYLIPRFEQLLGSTWASLLLTSIMFGGLHLDQGMGSVLNTVLAGLVYGGTFCLFRRLWPIVAAHAVYNLTISPLDQLIGTLGM
ncbi:MAG: CPBP family intramembrane glutamic endopeptidase [Candidatus Binatia bacterium]